MYYFFDWSRNYFRDQITRAHVYDFSFYNFYKIKKPIYLIEI